MDTATEERYVSPEAFARKAGMNPKTVLNMVEDGTLPIKDGPRGWLISTRYLSQAKTERANRAAAAGIPGQDVAPVSDTPDIQPTNQNGTSTHQPGVDDGINGFRHTDPEPAPVDEYTRLTSEGWLTTKELARLCGVTTTTLYSYRKDNDLVQRKIGRSVLWPPASRELVTNIKRQNAAERSARGAKNLAAGRAAQAAARGDVDPTPEPTRDHTPDHTPDPEPASKRPSRRADNLPIPSRTKVWLTSVELAGAAGMSVELIRRYTITGVVVGKDRNVKGVRKQLWYHRNMVDRAKAMRAAPQHERSEVAGQALAGNVMEPLPRAVRSVIDQQMSEDPSVPITAVDGTPMGPPPLTDEQVTEAVDDAFARPAHIPKPSAGEVSVKVTADTSELKQKMDDAQAQAERLNDVFQQLRVDPDPIAQIASSMRSIRMAVNSIAASLAPQPKQRHWYWGWWRRG